ncbi:cobalt-precorrin-6A reductase [Leisingera sp. SS27]|uniref:cobalt-precorrin-6A reductase n=1 Tax=Leisingera sp. SS27 TaxID=2979462 RepID=UPI00232B7CCC|nr:cobalt-precorrin-6A reductase [Leisingera sp. SS27]MDC0657939.1 cobalt-precorrin-6A reductase [Leisingera sp. SS27]
MTRILLLGGTSEASTLAKTLASVDMDAVFSYAGRTAKPVSQPLPTRVGGFGGVQGLAAYLQAECITHVVDATHPFAAQMSTNAVRACDAAGVPLCAFERPAWQAGEGDYWVHADSIEGAVNALPDTPARVFLAIGKQNLAQFAAKPQHHYLLRLVDAPEAPLPLPRTTVEIARGPFDVAGDTALMQRHGITHLVAKNAGGAGAEAKLTAARDLGLPVIMIGRPQVPERPVKGCVAEVMAWLSHSAT